MNPTSRRLLAVAALASLLLSGCDLDVLSSDDPKLEAPPTEEVAAVPEALSVGDTFEGDVLTTVVAVAKGGDPSWTSPGDGYDWLWANVRTCVPASGSTTEIGWYQWAVTGTDGGWYPADLDYDDDRPTNQFPRFLELTPGDCREGRVLIPVPVEAELITVVNADQSGQPQGTWLLDDSDAQADAGE